MGSTPEAAAVTPRSRRGRLFVTVALLLAVPGAGAAAGQPFVPTALVGDTRVDERALALWMDAWFRRQLADPLTGAPGGVVAVVEGGGMRLVRGYGLADIERRIPATSATVFRVGSLSKPVTATAIMQLVEAGRVDLHRPVSDYVRDVALPARFGRPITVLDLVTHSGGFDARLEGTAAASDAAVLPLGPYLRDHLPPQVRPAGDVIAYSNHGYALLGHLVEAVSGEGFESYAAAHVFDPLGMRASAFRFGPHVERKAAVGYVRAADGFRPTLVVHPHIYPAEGLCTTAEDMARFMVAHLSGGQLAGERILTEASTEQMNRRHFTMAPGVPGVAFGFFEFPSRGERALVHGGGIRGFMSGLFLWPGRQLGLFVANNGYSDRMVRDLADDFARRFLPAYTSPPEQRQDVRRLERYAGAYRPLAATVASLEKAGALRNGDLELGVDFRGQLTIGRRHFDHVGGGAFVRGDERLWIVDRPGRPSLVVTADPVNGVTGFERKPWYDTVRCHREILFACCMLFASTLAAGALRRFGPQEAAGRQGGRSPAPAVRLLLSVVASLNLLGLALAVAAFRSQAAGMLFGQPSLAWWAFRANVVAAALCPPLVLGLWPVWRSSGWPLAARVHCTLGVAACLAFAGWAHYWRLMG